MKLSTSNRFDVSEIAQTKSFQELAPFFEYFNSFVSDVVQLCGNRITLADNVSYKSLSLIVQHGTPINIGIYTPVGVFINSETPVSYYELSTNNDSSRNLSIKFKVPQYVFAKSAVWQSGNIVRYTVLDVAPYSVGETINVTNFGTASNNGIFQIIEIDSGSNYLYVINRARTSATGDEARTGYVGASLTKYRITAGIING